MQEEEYMRIIQPLFKKVAIYSNKIEESMLVYRIQQNKEKVKKN